MEDLKMFDYRQYKRGYYMPPVPCNDWVTKDHIDKAPLWCSVDLRDGIINYNGIITFNTKSANYFYLSDLDLKRFKGSFYKT